MIVVVQWLRNIEIFLEARADRLYSPLISRQRPFEESMVMRLARTTPLLDQQLTNGTRALSPAKNEKRTFKSGKNIYGQARGDCYRDSLISTN